MATQQASQKKNKPVEAMLEHEIQMRAYALYEERGKCEGHALDDWLEAEAEVLAHVGDRWG